MKKISSLESLRIGDLLKEAGAAVAVLLGALRLPSSEVLTAGTSPPTPQERRFFPRFPLLSCCWDVHVCLGGGTSSRLLPTCSRPRCASLCSVSDPQEAQLDAEVCSVSDAREEVLCVTGSAGRHAGSIRHRVIVDVFGQDAAALQQDSATGDGLGVSTTTVSRHACVCLCGWSAATSCGSTRTCWRGGC